MSTEQSTPACKMIGGRLMNTKAPLQSNIYSICHVIGSVLLSLAEITCCEDANNFLLFAIPPKLTDEKKSILVTCFETRHGLK